MRRQWVIEGNHPFNIKDFVLQQGISQRALKDIKMKGDILVNGIHQTVRYVLNKGDTLTLIYPQEDNQIIPWDYPLHIVYEDDYILIIDKEKGMPSIPTRAHPYHTLANALTAYYQSIHLSSTIHLVNRLDKETKGLMMVAKYRAIHDRMSKIHIYRKYRAHIQGEVSSGIIDLPIYCEGQGKKRIIDERGKPSVTHYHQISSSFVEFRLETGRTHQIRVHMSAIGHPLVGDELYGDREGEFDLESMMIAFMHPVTRQIKVIIKKKRFSK